ncbi:MAG: tRNA (adenosine(37)-N6)-threonylcarbamoyltransferase complex ATPase subunit type 1 TsaE [Methylococcaceae bacterium]|nr:tRNA (adenosine(37)-N6)-threonylcarbamoyltransferase complex ATPase subunit type 1 TsaE [Methylococcaceae bacterium]
MKLILANEKETELLGAELWRILPKKCLVFLHGGLGAGKTTLTRGVLRAAGHKSAVKSPTYTIVEEYKLANRCLYHFDLYRINDPEELEWIGIRDYLEQQCLSFIEWPELGNGFLPKPDIELTLVVEGKERIIDIHLVSEKLSNNLVLNWKNKNLVL